MMALDHNSFLNIAREIANASTCTRGNVGAVIVQDRRIVSTGYNGAPPGMPHCTEVGCDVRMVDKSVYDEPRLNVETTSGCQRAIHAELNAIAWAARHGVATDGGIMYATHGPCLKCAQAILACGIVEVHFVTPYRLHDGVLLLAQALRVVKEHYVLEEDELER
jgi:dCMP deaminase